MNTEQKLKVYSVGSIGPYLEIAGQHTDRDIDKVHSRIRQLLPTCFEFSATWSKQHVQSLMFPGAFCIYKRVNGEAPAEYEFLRARIHSLSDPGLVSTTMQVEVELLDYGYRSIVNSTELLFPKNPQLLENMPQLCTKFVLLGICNDWKQSDLDKVANIITSETIDVYVKHEFCKHKLASFMWKNFNFAEFLMHQKKIGVAVEYDLQIDHLKKIFDETIFEHGFNMKSNTNVGITSNNVQRGVGKTPTEIAREQIMAQRSLSARLNKHRQPYGDNSIQTSPTPSATELPLMEINNIMRNNTPPNMVAGIPSAGLLSQGNTRPVTRPTSPYNPLQKQQQMKPAPMEIYKMRYGPPPQYLGKVSPVKNYATRYVAPPPSDFKPTNVVASFKTSTLVVGQTYDVSITFVENGPYAFSIQLRVFHEELLAMMKSLEDVKLQAIQTVPNVGMACLARYSEDHHVYRALVSRNYKDSCRVLYVDYGNSETVSFKDLYVIPSEFLEAKPYSMRFTLSGAKQLEPIDDSLKKAFKDFVMFNYFKLTVMPLEGPPLVQYCQLLRNGVNVMDTLSEIKQSRTIYPKAEPLKDNDSVEIRYIASPQNFYVQKEKNFESFQKLMDEMFIYYNKNQHVPSELFLGAPCIVKYENDWYRAEVMRADSQAIIVRHVDFGYEQRVTKHLLSTISDQHVKMPRQAVQCCLKGFDNNEVKISSATSQFEMLAEESNEKRRLFNVRVYRIQPDGLNIVNLLSATLNVMKKLFKLCMPFEKYLTIEKDININEQNSHSLVNALSKDGTAITPYKNKNGGKFNQQYDNKSSQKPHQHQHQHQHQQQQQQHQRNNKINNGKNDSGDKSNSSTSSRDNRDSRSNSSELQRQHGGGSSGGGNVGSKRQPQQKQRKDDSNHKSPRSALDNSFENSCTNDDNISNGSSKKQLNGNVGEHSMPQSRIQNGKQEATNNMRFNKNQQQSPPRKQQYPEQSQQVNKQHQQQQQSHQQQQNHYQQEKTQQQQQLNNRPRNAPKGFSQNLQRQKSSLNASSLTTKNHNGKKSGNTKKEIYVSLDHEFPTEDLILNSEIEVHLCWWSSPFQFYIRLLSNQTIYNALHTEMLNFYGRRGNPQLQLNVGSNVIARYRKENAIMRARVISCNHMTKRYKLFFVDSGAQCIVTSEDIWKVEKRFSKQPRMAFHCSFEGITYYHDHYYLIDRIDKYLKGNSVKCILYKHTNNIYYANIFAGDVDLKATLISNRFVSVVPNEIRLTLLVGQQIRGTFTFIKDMLNFKIEFNSFGKKIEAFCAFEDERFVKSNSEIGKKFKKFYAGKSCIFNINAASEDHVLFVRPMMPLFMEDIYTNIVTLPVALNSFEAHIVHVETFYRFYVHPVEEKQRIKSLQDRMSKFYENSGLPLRKFIKGFICAAKSKDNQWYRARIISSAKTSTKVQFIDYGNQENIENKHFKMLAEQFYKFEIAAIEINLPIGRTTAEVVALGEIKKHKGKLVVIQPIGASKNHIIADAKIASNNQCVIELMEFALVKDRDVEYMYKFLEKDKSNCLEYIETVDLTMEDDEDQQAIASVASLSLKVEKNESNQPEEDKTVEKKDDEVESINTEVAEAFKNNTETSKPIPQDLANNIEIQDKEEMEKDVTPPSKSSTPDGLFAYMETGVLSHCDSPTQFYIHPNDKVDTLYRLQENLQIVSCSLPQLTQKIKGAQCISMYSVDKQWYRAKIMDAELMVLQFIDYGNTDCVSDTAEIKESLWSNLDPHCVPCALPICAKGTAEFVDAANDIFNNSYQKILYFEYLTRPNGDFNKKQYINLYVDGVNIAEKLIADGYAKPLQVVKSGEVCFISHMNSISDFYIQYERDSQAIDLIDQHLTNAIEEFEPLREFEKSRIVAALYSEDKRWYRAELLREVPGQGYNVRFIDYGNTGVTPECRLLLEEIANLPALSRKCEIELPEDRLAWSDEAEAKFKEISACETIFTVDLRKPTLDRVIVHLLIDDRNIIDDLAPLCAEKTKDSDNEYYFSSNNTSLHSSTIEKNNCKISAEVIQVESPNKFYVQFDKEADLIKNALKSIEPEIVAAIDVKIGEIYATRTDFDGQLYRVCTTELLPGAVESENDWRVVLIDFGDENIASELYQLPDDIKQIPPTVKQCCLEPSSKFNQFPTASTQTFNALLEACNCSVILEYVDCETVPAMVKLFSNDAKTSNISLNLHKLLETAESACEEKLASSSKPVAPAAVISGTKCLVSHVNNPNDFYIQLLRHTKDIEYVTETLTEYQLEALEEEDLTVGVFGVSYAPEEGYHCRCLIKKIIKDGEEGGQSYEVFLIDIGSVIVTTNLFKLPAKICGLPPLAFECSLADLPEDVDADKLKTAFMALIDAHFGEVFEVNEAQIKTTNPKKIVNLQFDYKDLTEELKKSIAGIELSPEPTLYDCSILQFNSAASFYLQLEQDIPALERVTDKLLDAEELFTACTHIEIGKIYAAQSPDDEVYYRAKPIQILKNGKYQVQLIDFGNTIITDKFRTLPDELKDLQPYSKHCQLENNAIAKSDGVKLQLFIDTKCSDTFQVEMLTTNERTSCIVRLFYKGKDILSLSEAN